MADWDANSPDLLRNPQELGRNVTADAAARRPVSSQAIGSWQTLIMRGLEPANGEPFGTYRGEAGLAGYDVEAGGPRAHRRTASRRNWLTSVAPGPRCRSGAVQHQSGNVNSFDTHLPVEPIRCVRLVRRATRPGPGRIGDPRSGAVAYAWTDRMASRGSGRCNNGDRSRR